MNIERFLREFKPIRSEYTRRSYRGFLRRFKTFLSEKHLTVETLHPSDIEAFAGWVKGRFNFKSGQPGMSDIAVQSHLAAVSSYYQWLQCRRPRLRNPVAGFKYRRTEVPKNAAIIEPDMATAMGDLSDSAESNVIVRLFNGSGIRLGELVSLNKNDIEIDMGPKGSGKKPCGIAKVKGKGGRTRTVLIGAKATKGLLDYLRSRGADTNPALILSSRNRRISRRTVQRLIKKAAAKVGASHCHPHELRHRFATDALDHGLPEKQLKKLLGQLDLQTTYRYIHTTDARVQEDFEQIMKNKSLFARRRSSARVAEKPIKRQKAA